MEEEWTHVTDGALIKMTQLTGEQAKAEQCWDSGVNGALCLESHPLEKYCGPAPQQELRQKTKQQPQYKD